MTATAKKKQYQPKTQPITPKRAPVIEHLHELRRRILYVLAAVFVGATGAYFIQQKLVHYLLIPSHHQQFIYTSPGGGIGFLFQVCTYVGILLAIPVAVVQLVGFLSPVVNERTQKWILRSALYSGLLALAGIALGYFVGLPAALHFLGNQFSTSQIHPLFTIQEYLSFVTFYLVGSALLFQLPLILSVINNIRPLPPRSLFKGERYVIVAAFIISMLMAPTVNVLNQLIIAIPIIVMYQVGIMLVWLSNRAGHRPDPEDSNTETTQYSIPPGPVSSPRLSSLVNQPRPDITPFRPLTLTPIESRPVSEYSELSNEGLTGDALFGLLARRNSRGDSYGSLNQPIS